MSTFRTVCIRAAVLVVTTALWLAPKTPDAAADDRTPRASTADGEVELGRRLFFETALSISGLRSCATCHDPEHGFSDDEPLSRDETGFTFRHSQTLVDIDARKGVHWNGEVEDISELVRNRTLALFWGAEIGPFRAVRPDAPDAAERWSALQRALTGAEKGGGAEGLRAALASEGLGLLRHSNPSTDLESAGRYREAFVGVHGSASPTVPRLGAALTAYLRTLRSSTSVVDRFFQGEHRALSASARRGLELFRGKARCAECHRLEPQDGRPPLSDFRFHNTGVAWKAEQTRVAAGLPDLLLYIRSGEPRLRAPNEPGDPGRALVYAGTRHERAFKTPTLRDVSRRGPFMHDGSLATLADVVDHYAKGTGTDPQRDERVRGFEASEPERDDLVAFLEALAGEQRPGIAREAWERRAKTTRLTFVGDDHAPLADLAVEVVPEGDTLPGAVGPETRLRLKTDSRGRLAFTPFARTHARLVLPEGLVPVGGPLVPDTCAEAEITLPVKGRGGLVVAFAPGQAAPSVLSAAHLNPDLQQGWPQSTQGSLFGGLLVDVRTTLRRTAVSGVAGRDVAAYEGWVRSDLGPTILLLVPGEKNPRFVTLKPGATVHVDATRPSVP